jgi:hypothetical protein
MPAVHAGHAQHHAPPTTADEPEDLLFGVHGGLQDVGRRDRVAVRQPPRPAVGVDRGEAGVDHAAHPGGQCGVDQVAGAVPADAVVVLPGVPAPRPAGRDDPGGQVQDRVGAADRRNQRRGTQQPAGDRLGSGRTQPTGRLRSGGERPDPVAGLQEAGDGGRTERAGPAGDQDDHRSARPVARWVVRSARWVIGCPLGEKWSCASLCDRPSGARTGEIAGSPAGCGNPAARHRDLGLVVDLGPWTAVARPLGVPLWGPAAAVVTRGYHLLALPSAAGRIRVLVDWLLDLVLPPQLTRFEGAHPAVRSGEGYQPSAGTMHSTAAPALPSVVTRSRGSA